MQRGAGEDKRKAGGLRGGGDKVREDSFGETLRELHGVLGIRWGALLGCAADKAVRYADPEEPVGVGPHEKARPNKHAERRHG